MHPPYMNQNLKINHHPFIIIHLPSCTITHAHPNLICNGMHHPYIDTHAWPSLPIKPNPKPVPANTATPELHDAAIILLTPLSMQSQYLIVI